MKEQIDCLICKKTIWRNKLKGQVETIGDCLCQMCKNRVRRMFQKERIKVIDNEKYYNILKQSIDKLVMMEKLKPELLEELRKGVKKNNGRVNQ